MTGFTDEQVEEIVREAVEKTEKSFGGTFKRLKSENEELKSKFETTISDYDSVKNDMEKKIGELESKLAERKKHISELAIKSEIQKQLKNKGHLPENFIEVEKIQYSDDPEILGSNVSSELEAGRKRLEDAMQNIGISMPQNQQITVNPTNPPSRDTKTAHALKRVGAQDVLQDMVKRGLIR